MLGAETAHGVAQLAVGEYGALQDETELAALLVMLDANGAGLIAEIGTWAGGLTWALTQLDTCDYVFTIDNNPRPKFLETYRQIENSCTLINGDSTQYDTLQRLTGQLGGASLDVLVIDGGHFYAEARADWDRYHDLVSPGGIVVIHDTQGAPDNKWVEVPKLWAELAAEYTSTVELVAKPGQAGTGLIWMP